MILDIGCGNNPKGDVNCDLYIEKTPHRVGKLVEEVIDAKNIKNFVLCDCGSKHFKFLPFQSKAFSMVRSDHGIEHFERFDKTIKEMIRVARDEVDISTPHRYWRASPFKGQNPTHINFFGVKYFRRLVRTFGYDAQIHVRYSFPFRIPFFSLPHEIFVKIHLRGRK